MDKVKKSESEWRSQLTADQFDVCRKKSTERPYSGKYENCKDVGDYHCICCEQPLFSSHHKFDSGTGWPSFTKPITDGAVAEKDDFGLFSRRTEVLCARCDAHLGHVFADGPGPGGMRYCMNSVALNLKPKKL